MLLIFEKLKDVKQNDSYDALISMMNSISHSIACKMPTPTLCNPANHVSFNISWHYSKSLCVMFEYAELMYIKSLGALCFESKLVVTQCCCNVVRIRNERNLNTTRYSAQLNSKQIDLEKRFSREVL